MPIELHSPEAVTRPTDERLVLADNSECAEREGLDVGARLQKGRSLFLDSASVAEGGESVHPHRESGKSEAEVVAGGGLESVSYGLEIPSQERKAQPGGLEREVVPLHAQLFGRPLEFGRSSLVSNDSACDSTDEQ